MRLSGGLFPSIFQRKCGNRGQIEAKTGWKVVSSKQKPQTLIGLPVSQRQRDVSASVVTLDAIQVDGSTTWIVGVWPGGTGGVRIGPLADLKDSYGGSGSTLRAGRQPLLVLVIFHCRWLERMAPTCNVWQHLIHH